MQIIFWYQIINSWYCTEILFSHDTIENLHKNSSKHLFGCKILLSGFNCITIASVWFIELNKMRIVHVKVDYRQYSKAGPYIELQLNKMLVEMIQTSQINCIKIIIHKNQCVMRPFTKNYTYLYNQPSHGLDLHDIGVARRVSFRTSFYNYALTSSITSTHSLEQYDVNT